MALRGVQVEGLVENHKLLILKVLLIDLKSHLLSAQMLINQLFLNRKDTSNHIIDLSLVESFLDFIDINLKLFFEEG